MLVIAQTQYPLNSWILHQLKKITNSKREQEQQDIEVSVGTCQNEKIGVCWTALYQATNVWIWNKGREWNRRTDKTMPKISSQASPFKNARLDQTIISS